MYTFLIKDNLKSKTEELIQYEKIFKQDVSVNETRVLLI